MARLKKEERQKQIIEAACSVFAERGLAGTRTREIAEACGINEAVIYRHFKSKEDLFAQVMAHLYESMIGSWRRILREAPDGRTALKRIVDAQTAATFGNPMICGAVMHGLAASTSDEKLRGMIVGWFANHQRLLVDVLRKGMEDGSLRPDLDPDLIAWWLRGLGWMGVLASAVEVGGSLTPESVIRMHEEIITYLAPRGKADSENPD